MTLSMTFHYQGFKQLSPYNAAFSLSILFFQGFFKAEMKLSTTRRPRRLTKAGNKQDKDETKNILKRESEYLVKDLNINQRNQQKTNTKKKTKNKTDKAKKIAERKGKIKPQNEEKKKQKIGG